VVCALLSAFCLASATLPAGAQSPATRLRMNMVHEQIEERGIRDARVLEAMRSTARHLFVPDDLIERAYSDYPLPIGHGATISQPYIVAFMTELLDVQPAHKVLEIGTGSGYQAAILSQLAARVCSIEIVPELAREASVRLRELGYAKVKVLTGDGYLGWPDEAPFDRIILTAAPIEIPRALLDQLKPGGRLVAPVGGTHQYLYLVEKRPGGTVRRTISIPVRFVPMTTRPHP
jgi:protein-L-isoaspartate(D-aspartate) O-methyltransferase